MKLKKQKFLTILLKSRLKNRLRKQKKKQNLLKMI